SSPTAKTYSRASVTGASQNALRMIQCVVSSCAFAARARPSFGEEPGERNCDRIARGLEGRRVPEEQPADGRSAHGNQERRVANPPGRRREGHRGAAQERPPDGT